ncbi:hypothetical protein MXE95_03195 [Aeromonas caviae]|uniref:hypothetical protein n=1 Tax=Aeromonas caviae TaxID=648 RepID=UPI002DBFE03D|nr:hypothetical protein [Aeromonas caviae]MEB5773120.1 hypothetical protein [Aeromonas caviae]MEB6648335.1 hypothetical protein [Aeromonas caviae]
MSLLAALAKGIGAGTVDNAKVGFAEQQRQREAIQRKEEMGVEFDRRDAQIKAQIDAGIADTKTRIDAQTEENEKQRAHDLDMLEKRVGAEFAKANASASAKGRENYAKNLMSSLDAINKRMTEVTLDDKISDEQRKQELARLKYAGAMFTADPNAQQMLNEHGGGGYVTYFQSFMPDVSPQGEGGGEAPPPQATTAPPRPGSAGSGSATPDGRPAYTKEGYGGLIPHIQQGGERAAEAAVINQMLSAPVLNRNANKSTQAADAYQRMYQR